MKKLPKTTAIRGGSRARLPCSRCKNLQLLWLLIDGADEALFASSPALKLSCHLLWIFLPIRFCESLWTPPLRTACRVSPHFRLRFGLSVPHRFYAALCQLPLCL